MKVYIACHSVELVANAAAKLHAAGIIIHSTWHWQEFLPTEQHSESERREIAERDRREVRESDALVLIAGPDKYSGGKFVEAGIAIGSGVPVVVLGRRENMLLWLGEVEAFDEISDVAAYLQSLSRRIAECDTLS